MSKFISTLVLVFCGTILIAQVNQKETSPATNYTFDAPDATFTTIDNGIGYKNEDGSARIQLSFFPSSYENAIKPMPAPEGEMEYLMNDASKSATNEKGHLQKILIGTEAKGTMGVAFFMPHKEGTLVVQGSYPADQDKAMHDKYLAACKSIRMK